MAQEEYDVVVVGARVAGATTAALVGDAGYRVLLIDRHVFPSATLSTHFFRGADLVSVLKRLRVLDRVLETRCPPLTCEYAYVNGTADRQQRPPQRPGDIGYCLSVRRTTLDHLLVRRACQSSTVELLERCRLTQLHWTAGRLAELELSTPEGVRRVRARAVVGADGRHSFVARVVQAPTEEAAEPLRALYYCYVRQFPGPSGGQPDGPEFSRLDDEIAYVFPSDDGVTCIAISINRAAFGWIKKALAARFRERLLAHRGLADRFVAAFAASEVLGSGPEPNYMRVPWGPGWALVGDAGLHQDPWSGQGMDMAGVHGTFLAEALLEWFSGAASPVDALAAYHRRRNEHALEIYRNTVTVGRDLRQLGW